MRFLIKSFGKFWYLYLIGIAAGAFIILATTRKQLKAYRSGIDSSTYTVQQETQTEENIPTVTFNASGINMSMQVPEGWTKVIKSGFDTFIHAPSGSSLQIQVLSYDPAINNENEQTESEKCSSIGAELTGFQRTTANSFIASYTKANEAGETNYLMDFIWDRDHILKVLASANSQYASKMDPIIMKCMDSIVWNFEDPIPDGFVLVYQKQSGFEFAVPSDWTYGESDGAAYAEDSNTGASLAVSQTDIGKTFVDITQLDYSSFLSSGKQDYRLQSFSKDNDHIYAEAIYTNNSGVSTGIMQTAYPLGDGLFVISYEFPVDNSDSLYSFIQSGLSVTRFFPSTPETESEAEPQDSSFAPFSIPSGKDNDESENQGSGTSENSDAAAGDNDHAVEQTEEKESESENSLKGWDALSSMANELKSSKSSSGSFGSSTSGNSSDGSDVATFSDALVTVAGISSEKADEASDIWDNLSLGTPSFATAYEESSSVLSVQVRVEDGTIYYLYFSKSSGDLQGITTEGGKTIWNR